MLDCTYYIYNTEYIVPTLHIILYTQILYGHSFTMRMFDVWVRKKTGAMTAAIALRECTIYV